MKKVFVNEDDKAIFVCPKCEKATTKDVSQYKDINQSVKVKCRCSCGQVYSVLIERRKYYRKAADLPGIFVSATHGRGTMTVKDISRFGLKFEVGTDRKWKVGDMVTVEFTLDDSHKTEIRKDVIIRTIAGPLLGTEFVSVNSVDLADRRLGFYLMP